LVASSPDTWTSNDQAAFARVQDLFLADSFHDCLIAAGALLDRAKNTGQSGVYRVLGELIRECASLVAPSDEATNVDPACSFCGRKPPEVKLGAGPKAFICDGCVDVFASLFKVTPREPAS
jgi:hypothetical protein